MRINKFVAQASGLSRRWADNAIEQGRVTINAQPVQPGQDVNAADTVMLDGKQLTAPQTTQTILLNKPIDYVVSRDGQGSHTIYELLPTELRDLKPVGRLDKDSSGLLLLTTDGQLAHQLTHPSFQKTKVYEITLGSPLTSQHQQTITGPGVQLEDGPSKLQLEKLDSSGKAWRVIMHEGRNRQIRRTFAAPGYTVRRLHRTHLGNYALGDLQSGEYRHIS